MIVMVNLADHLSLAFSSSTHKWETRVAYFTDGR